MIRTSAEISSWLAARIAHYAEVDIQTVDFNSDISSLRLDSIIMVNITSELGEWIGMPVSPTLLWEMRTISATSDWIIENQEE